MLQLIPKMMKSSCAEPFAGQSDLEFFQGLDSDEKATLRRLLGKLVEYHQIQNVPIE